MRKTMLGGFRPLSAAVLAVSLGCGSDLVLPTDGSGVGLDISIVDGDRQEGHVGEALAKPLKVKVFAEGNRPVPGRRVAFVLTAGTGTLDPDTTETDDKGEAVASWFLGKTPGEHVVEARLVTDLAEPPVAQFMASATAADPDTLRNVSPLGQPGRRGDELEDSLVVAVVDRFGNPVPDIAVEWDVTVGEGQVSADESRTGADGMAAVQWTLGGRIGVQKATATVVGPSNSPVTFWATVLP